MRFWTEERCEICRTMCRASGSVQQLGRRSSCRTALSIALWRTRQTPNGQRPLFPDVGRRIDNALKVPFGASRQCSDL